MGTDCSAPRELHLFFKRCNSPFMSDLFGCNNAADLVLIFSRAVDVYQPLLAVNRRRPYFNDSAPLVDAANDVESCFRFRGRAKGREKDQYHDNHQSEPGDLIHDFSHNFSPFILSI